MNLDDTLTLEQLSVSFSTDDGVLPAVHAVSLSLPPKMPISAAASCSAAATCAP